ncbi:MAG: hypothetical protein OSJ73_21890, partial [Lachnospiraceae bacterium]|nr:hypothetical protein [Lachnospiraceae bacterium]
SGVSIPVFNTIDDAVAYSVANNLYYTSSDYTGEGKEIIIEFDQIENINNGYYTDMYTLLQQMIEQKGGNALTPEQLQQIVDEVRASFGLIKDEINKGFQQQDILIQKNSGILQNIADALNTFFAETKRFRESMDELLRDYIGGGGGTVGSETKDYHIKIQSVPNSNLAANQREFSIETDMENPYYESCLAWYPLNGISDIQYTGSNTCILTFFNYNKRYNVYCKYNDTGQDIRCTSNTVSVTIGAPDEPPLDDTNIWDGFADSLNEKLTDIKNSLVDLHDDMNAKFGTLNESVDSFASSFAHFSQNCLGYLKEIKDNIGSNKQLPGLPAPDGGDWDILEFLLDIAKNIADNSIDEATQKVGDLISEILTGISDIFGMLSEVFPFSIPWDIALLIGALSAEPEAPYFEVPFKLDSWGIECTLVLDFEQFEIMSTISRAFLSLTWAMYLMNFTVKFTDTKNL